MTGNYTWFDTVKDKNVLTAKQITSRRLSSTQKLDRRRLFGDLENLTSCDKWFIPPYRPPVELRQLSCASSSNRNKQEDCLSSFSAILALQAMIQFTVNQFVAMVTGGHGSNQLILKTDLATFSNVTTCGRLPKNSLTKGMLDMFDRLNMLRNV
jgi:hypothetical protein